MARKGVKPGTKRGSYKPKTAEELARAKAAREEAAEMLLPEYLYRESWSRKWSSPEMLEKAFLLAFAGMTVQSGSKLIGVPETEFLRALDAFPELKGHWLQGQEATVEACHRALLKRIQGVTVRETRTTTKSDGAVERVEIEKELPPDIDAVKFFLQHRVTEYQDASPVDAFEGRLDTMLGRIEQQMDLFDK